MARIFMIDAYFPLPRGQVSYGRHIECIQQDVLFPIAQILLPVWRRDILCILGHDNV